MPVDTVTVWEAWLCNDIDFWKKWFQPIPGPENKAPNKETQCCRMSQGGLGHWILQRNGATHRTPCVSQ